MRAALKKNTEFSRADFHGFTLKYGFLYGTTCRGQYAASSGWRVHNDSYGYDDIAIYVKTESGWELRWMPEHRVAVI